MCLDAEAFFCTSHRKSGILHNVALRCGIPLDPNLNLNPQTSGRLSGHSEDPPGRYEALVNNEATYIFFDCSFINCVNAWSLFYLPYFPWNVFDAVNGWSLQVHYSPAESTCTLCLRWWSVGCVRVLWLWSGVWNRVIPQTRWACLARCSFPWVHTFITICFSIQSSNWNEIKITNLGFWIVFVSPSSSTTKPPMLLLR